MSARLMLLGSALATAALAGGIAGFTARAGEHPNVEPTAAAGCIGCHEADYRAARHHVGEKPTTCGVCHGQSSWHARHFDHPFALSGAHAKASSCFECHRGEPAVFHGTPGTCYGCHAEEYQRAKDHVGHFATTCEDCHGFDAWKPAVHQEVLEPPPEPPPPPVPTVTATASTPPVPPPKPKPKPKPTATATTTVKPVPTIDVVTHGSRRE